MSPWTQAEGIPAERERDETTSIDSSSINQRDLWGRAFRWMIHYDPPCICCAYPWAGELWAPSPWNLELHKLHNDLRLIELIARPIQGELCAAILIRLYWLPEKIPEERQRPTLMVQPGRLNHSEIGAMMIVCDQLRETVWFMQPMNALLHPGSLQRHLAQFIASNSVNGASSEWSKFDRTINEAKRN